MAGKLFFLIGSQNSYGTKHSGPKVHLSLKKHRLVYKRKQYHVSTFDKITGHSNQLNHNHQKCLPVLDLYPLYQLLDRKFKLINSIFIEIDTKIDNFLTTVNIP
jgi:hypothetical protein